MREVRWTLFSPQFRQRFSGAVQCAFLLQARALDVSAQRPRSAQKSFCLPGASLIVVIHHRKGSFENDSWV